MNLFLKSCETRRRLIPDWLEMRLTSDAMYSLFALLFKRDYWRFLLRGGTWVDAWDSLRRAHKDKRARKHLRAFAFMLFIPCVCFAYLAWLAGSGALFILPFLLPLIWWNNRRRKQDETPLHIVPQPVAPIRELSEKERAALRSFFGESALFYAVMTDRAGSEGFLKEKVLPEGFEVTSRRNQIDILQSTGLWERMAQRDREAMMMPDGHWDWPLINEVARQLERLRLLRWILRIDYYLPVIGRQLRSDYNLAHEIVRSPQKALAGKELATVEQIEVARSAAEEFFARCLAEALSRGYYTIENELMRQWAKEVSASLKGKQHEDLLLGEKLVSEADEEVLLWATNLSRNRFRFLTWSLALRDGAELPPGVLSVFPQEEPPTV